MYSLSFFVFIRTSDMIYLHMMLFYILPQVLPAGNTLFEIFLLTYSPWINPGDSNIIKERLLGRSYNFSFKS